MSDFGAGIGTRTFRWRDDLREAAELSRSTNRPMLVRVSAEWCGHCRRMDTETFTDSGLQQVLGSQYIPVQVDADQQREFTERMRITSLPTILVVSPEMAVTDRIEGFRSADQLRQKLGVRPALPPASRMRSDASRFRAIPVRHQRVIADDLRRSVVR